MNLKRKFGSALIAFLALLALTACGSKNDEGFAKDNESSVEAIKKRGKINIAVFGDLSPYGYIDKNGKNQGYDVYLAHRIAKDLLGDEKKVNFVTVNAEERVDTLNSNKADLVLANFTKTTDRDKIVSFAKPYMKVSIGVVSPKDKVITMKNLKKSTIIVTKGTTAQIYFTQKQKDVALEVFDSKTQQFAALKDKRADALADDNSYLYAWAKDNPEFTVGIKEIGEVSTINPAVKKGNKSLLKWVNKELTVLGDEKFFEKDFNETLKPFFGSGIKAQDIILEGRE